MTDSILDDGQKRTISTLLEATIRIGVLVAIAVACFALLKPFLLLVAWGAIIAVAFYPLFLKVRRWVGGRNGLAATLLSLVLIAAIVIPSVILSESLIDSASHMYESVEAGQMRIPPPPDKVADWPVIGEKAYSLWTQASRNLDSFVATFKPQIQKVGRSALGLMASGGKAILFTIIALGIAGAFLASAEACTRGLKALSRRLAGDDGEAFVSDSALVVRSVAVGVIGIALVQALLAGIGMALVDVPLTPLWTLLVLILAVAQIPPLVVLGPVIVYVIANADPVPAVIFTIWGLFVSVSDAILKPLFLGRGLEIPTLVILLGAIGGLITMGVIGLFIGAVVLAIGWQLLTAWVTGDVEAIEEPEFQPEK
ncbi:MAG: AI-2E family transporter [Gemmatimonadetes bacterium]|nr:AI-2E family transporter [Gemmatimonadota bacterium]